MSRPFPTATLRHSLGPHGIPVSPFVLGMVGHPAIVPAAFDAGINAFFVTADMHWPLYENLRRGLELLFDRGAHVRDEVCIFSVSYVTQPEFCIVPHREVIDAVRGLGHVDATVIGGAYEHNLRERLPAYQEHRNGTVKGVRATGASFHERQACVQAFAENLLDLAFIRYNPAHRGAEEDVFKAPRPPGTLLYNFNSTRLAVSRSRFAELGLEAEYWYPEVTDYYRFALTPGMFDGLLFAFSTEKQLHQTLEGIARGPLTEEEVLFMGDLADLNLGYAKLAED